MIHITDLKCKGCAYFVKTGTDCSLDFGQCRQCRPFVTIYEDDSCGEYLSKNLDNWGLVDKGPQVGPEDL